MAEERYGARTVREARLESIPNPNPERNYLISITLPEFTCVCPVSGYPDFATIHVRYVPDQRCVELKALKLYINGFRDQEMFHEAATNRILDDLVTLLAPRWIEVVGDFNPRGNVKTVIRATHGVRPPEVEQVEAL